MKHLIIPLITLLLLANCANGQDVTSSASFRFFWNEANYLFYDTYDLKMLSFESALTQEQIQKAAKQINVIERVEFDNGKGIMYFKSNPQPSDIRKFAEKAGLPEIYVNNTRLHPSALINPADIQKIKEKQAPAATPFQKESNEPGTLENIVFNIQFFETKLYSMQITNYPLYLYNGKITEYTEKLIEYQLKLNQLTTKN